MMARQIGEISLDLTDSQLESIFEPVGAFIVHFSAFDACIARFLEGFVGPSDTGMVYHVLCAVDAGSKKKMVDALSSIYAADPLQLVADFQPQAEARRQVKHIANEYGAMAEIRNTLAHGLPGRIGERLFMGSVAATQIFKNDGGREKFVFMDEMEQHVYRMSVARDKTRELTQRIVGGRAEVLAGIGKK